MSEFFTGLSDFFSNNWGQLVAILTSSTVLPTIISCIFKAFTTKAQNKSIKNLISAIETKFNSIETKLTAIEEKYKNLSSQCLKDFAEVVDKKFRELAEQYSSAKKKLCEQVLAGKEELIEVLEEVDNIVVEVENMTEEIEEKLQDEQSIVEEPIVEEIQEQAVEEVETPKTDVKVAKRVIVVEE